MTESAGRALRFLVVEDEVMIALLLEDYLRDMGHGMAWHADNIGDALRLATTEPRIDGAVLDLNLHGQLVSPVADALAARDIPFCFMTGEGGDAVTGYPGAPLIGKPFGIATFQAMIRKLIARA